MIFCQYQKVRGGCKMSNQLTKKRATLRDVAGYCNLSLATVSRVLAKSDYTVSEQTRDAVWAAAKALNYTPNALARNLKTQNTRTVGVIVPNITNPYYAQLLLGIGDAAMRAGYNILIYNSYRSGEVENKGIEMLIRERAAGILLVSISDGENLIQHALDLSIPVVTLEQKLPNRQAGSCHIGFDYAKGAKMAVDYLYEKGHRRIAFAGAPLVYHSRREMLAGYRAAIEEKGIEPKDAPEWLGINEMDTTKLYELGNGEACAEAFTKLPNPPTAYLCINDQSAIGLIKGLRKLGVKVPGDVSVMGFDNIPQGELITPSLTTVDQKAYEMGSLSFEKLLQKIKNPDSEVEPVMLSPQIIERDSVCEQGKK